MTARSIKNVSWAFPLVRTFGGHKDISASSVQHSVPFLWELYLSYLKHTIGGRGTWLQAQWPQEGMNIPTLWKNYPKFSKMKFVPRFIQLENNRVRVQTQFFVIPRTLLFIGNDREQNSSKIDMLQTGTRSCHWGHIVPVSSGNSLGKGTKHFHGVELAKEASRNSNGLSRIRISYKESNLGGQGVIYKGNRGGQSVARLGIFGERWESILLSQENTSQSKTNTKSAETCFMSRKPLGTIQRAPFEENGFFIFTC